MNYNNLTFTTIEEKKLNYKHVIFVIIAFIIIIVSVVLLVRSNFKDATDSNISVEYKSEVDSSYNVEQEFYIEQENIVDNVDIIQEVRQLPMYSENAKIEMSHIYKSDVKRVFLTFDDGPSQTVTPLILDILKQNDIKATFFVLGSRVELSPEILKQEYNEGHYIANHGYSHSYNNIYALAENVINEYNQTEDCIRKALEIPEYSSHLFRFPGGSTGGKYSEIKKEAINILGANDVAYVDWNALTRDAEGTFNKEQLYSNLIETVQNKNSIVVLMHDSGNKISTVEALQDVINYFRDNGYVFMNFYDIMK